MSTSNNIIWLHGSPGCGKSTISFTLAEHFNSILRLGAYLHFHDGSSSPSSVIATIASGSGDRTVRIWDSETGNLVAGPFQGHSLSVNSVAFSPDGTRIASGSSDKTVRIWDSETGKLVAGPLKGHTYYVTSAAFSPDGTRIASGSADSTVRIWDS